MTFDLTRRGLVAGAAALLPTAAFGQAKAQLAPLTSILTGRTYGPDAPPVAYPDPDILILSPEGNKVFIGHDAVYGRLILIVIYMQLVIGQLQIQNTVGQAADKVLHQPGRHSDSAFLADF